MLPRNAPSVILLRPKRFQTPSNPFELKLLSTRLSPGGNRAALTTTALHAQETKDAQYKQIPENLKIHSFTPELEILRYDELRAPFKNFSGNFILKLLEERSNEIRLEKENSNPSSRLNNDNVVRFMKVLANLRQLFDINGGNTEVLDAVLNSQATFNQLELKLAAKNREREEEMALDSIRSVYSPECVTKIPESLELHNFVDELVLFKRQQLKKAYGEVSAQELITSMENMLQRGYLKEVALKNNDLRRFSDLLPKLKKLLASNGGATFVLDSLVGSYAVSSKVDEKPQVADQKAKPSNDEKSEIAEQGQLVYESAPEDAFLEEYIKELETLRSSLDSSFTDTSSDVILEKVEELSLLQPSGEERLAFSKLYRNLSTLFKLNHGSTFVLDAVLVNNSAFNKLEESLASRLNQPVSSISDLDYLTTLLNSSEDAGTADLREEERTIQSALAQAMSKKEKILLENDPVEYREVVNPTSKKIRGKYSRPAVENGKQVDKDQIQNFLKKVKQRKISEEEDMWREQTAFEWTTSHIKDHRSFHARNFFNSRENSRIKFPMFPGTGEENKYLILTSNGQKFHTQRNPLGVSHIPQDMFTILQTLSEEDLAKFSTNVEKLRRKGWRLIGTGKTKGMLVLSKEIRDRRFKIGNSVRFVLTAAGALFVALICSNFLIFDNSSRETGKVSLPEAKENVSLSLQEKKNRKGFWYRLLWK